MLVVGTFLLGFGAFVLLYGSADGSFPSIGASILGGLALLLGGGLVVNNLRPFRFHIGDEGLTLRVPGINRLVPWAEIDALILDEPPPKLGGNNYRPLSLLLVPAGGSIFDRPPPARSPVDGRDGLVILDLHDVRQRPEDVAAALVRFGGSRFTDMRQLRRQRLNSPDFPIALRGYDPARVDDLIRRGQEALISDRLAQRFAAKAEIDGVRQALPVAGRGYDRQQVDAFLDELSAALGAW